MLHPGIQTQSSTHDKIQIISSGRMFKANLRSLEKKKLAVTIIIDFKRMLPNICFGLVAHKSFRVFMRSAAFHWQRSVKCSAILLYIICNICSVSFKY